MLLIIPIVLEVKEPTYANLDCGMISTAFIKVTFILNQHNQQFKYPSLCHPFVPSFPKWIRVSYNKPIKKLAKRLLRFDNALEQTVKLQMETENDKGKNRTPWKFEESFLFLFLVFSACQSFVSGTADRYFLCWWMGFAFLGNGFGGRERVER